MKIRKIQILLILFLLVVALAGYFILQKKISTSLKDTKCNVNTASQMIRSTSVEYPFRQPVAGRTLLWSRNQMKYGLYQNYLHYWMDRPLLADRSLRPWPWEVSTYPDFSRSLAQMQSYGLDGVSELVGTRGRIARFSRMADYVTQTALPEFYFVPETGVIPEENPTGELNCDLDAEILRISLKSPACRRIGGKVLLTSYSGFKATPKQWANYLRALRSKLGDTFLFVCDIDAGPEGKNKMQYDIRLNGGCIPPGMIDRSKEYIRSYLDVCDGVMFEGGHQLRTPDGFNASFYRDVVVKAFSEVLSEPKYKGKLLGLCAQVGYINRFTASTLWESGTRTLRESMEIALKARPDFIILPEWNEANECTSIQPTVMRGFSNKRLIRYYTDLNKNQPPQPLPGDDTSCPNLVVSYRYNLKLGEVLSIELLNIPDRSAGKDYVASLSLVDTAGKEIKRFPPATFNEAVLRNQTFDIATEELAGYPALYPVLDITGPGDRKMNINRGLRHIRLQATWNNNRLCYKQGLRDLLLPKDAELSVTGNNDTVQLSGRIDCQENLSSVEVLRDDQEIYAVGQEKEYPADSVTLLVYYAALHSQPKFSTRMTVENASFTFHPRLQADTVFNNFSIHGNTVEIRQWAWTNQHGFFLSIPQKEVDKAVLNFESDDIRTCIPVRRILEQGAYGENFRNTLRLRIEKFRDLPDLPPPLRTTQAAFHTVRANDTSEQSVYHLRVITESGKEWRSPPVFLDTINKQSTTMNVFSTSKNIPVPIEMTNSRIPDIKYDFSGKAGTVLTTPEGKRWQAELGGGSEYGQPFSLNRFPNNFHNPVPSFVTEDGYTCLKFNGKSNYLNLPQCVVPQGEFRLSMEIKPIGANPQLLLCCYGQYPGPLTLWLKNGKLGGQYLAALLPGDREQWYKTIDLNPEIEVPTGEWSKVEVIYDLKNFVFQVNGRSSNPISGQRQGCAFSPAVFGGFTISPLSSAGEFNGFEGYLRSFQIRHAANGGWGVDSATTSGGRVE